MPEENGSVQEKKAARPALWPLIITALLVCATAFALWQIWSSHAAAARGAEAQQRRLAELTTIRDELKSLLSLPPCDAKKRAAPVSAAEPGAAGVPAAAQAQKQATAPAGAAANTASKAASIEKACVFLVSTDGKSSLSTGSGFFVAPGYVLTNRHVVRNGKVFVTSKGLGHPVVAKVVATSSGKNEDYALLALQIPPDADIAVLPLARNVEKTEKVGAWGYPHIVGKGDPAYARLLKGEDFSATPELSYTEGVVSAILASSPQIIVHTAPISPGNSGGPLVNDAGEVVGINTMIVLDDSSYRQASLALSARDLAHFLAEHGLKL